MKFIKTESAFNTANEKSWRENATFWATQTARCEKNSKIAKFFLNTVRDVMKSRKSANIIDAGCGHGWIYDDLQATRPDKFKYIGLDYTPEFIKSNSERTKDSKNATFVQYDLTNPNTPKNLAGQGDIIINYFNLIEVWDMKSVFRNMHSMMRPDGIMMIATTDPLSSIASLSTDNADYNKNLKTYMQYKDNGIGWGEEIILGGTKRTGRTFYTAAHSINDYIAEAAKYEMYLSNIKEMLYHEVTVPQISMLMQFRKKR